MRRYNILVLLALIGSSTHVCAQAALDRQLLADRDFQQQALFVQYKGPGNSDRAIQTRRRSWVSKYNPVSLVLKGAMLGYQRLMSEQLARSCPYELTCSNFSKQAIETFGPLKGVPLSADRLMRCNRIGLLDVPAMDVSQATGLINDPISRYR